MKVLFLVQKEQRVILDHLYDGVVENCECDLRWLSSEDQASLKEYFNKKVDVSEYDRILFFLRFKKEIKQVAFIRTIPNLVILEHDAYQNYMPGKYHGKFSAHYRRLPGARIITSGFEVTSRLQSEGFDACFVPKGYDQCLLHNMGLERDIELGFIGSIKSDAYSERRALLEALGKVENLMITRTNSGDDYLRMLNRIRFFVSADVGMGEYMIKNFEAMACGCILLAYNQGEMENRALGFVDMHNIVLYQDVAELRNKLQILRGEPALAESIAKAGCELATSRYSFASLGKMIVDAMRHPLRLRPPLTWVEQLRAHWNWLP